MRGRSAPRIGRRDVGRRAGSTLGARLARRRPALGRARAVRRRVAPRTRPRRCRTARVAPPCARCSRGAHPPPRDGRAQLARSDQRESCDIAPPVVRRRRARPDRRPTGRRLAAGDPGGDRRARAHDARESRHRRRARSALADAPDAARGALPPPTRRGCRRAPGAGGRRDARTCRDRAACDGRRHPAACGRHAGASRGDPQAGAGCPASVHAPHAVERAGARPVDAGRVVRRHPGAGNPGARRRDALAGRRRRRVPPRGPDGERAPGRGRRDRRRPRRDPARDAGVRARATGPRWRRMSGRRSKAPSSTSGCRAPPPLGPGDAAPSRSPSTVDSRAIPARALLRRRRRDRGLGAARRPGRPRLPAHELAARAVRLPRAHVGDRGRREHRDGAVRPQRDPPRPPRLEREAPRLVGGLDPARPRAPLHDRGARGWPPRRAGLGREPLSAQRRRPDAHLRRPCRAGRHAARARDPARHGAHPRRRVRLRQAPRRCRLEGVLRRWGVATAVRAGRRSRPGMAGVLTAASGRTLAPGGDRGAHDRRRRETGARPSRAGRGPPRHGAFCAARHHRAER